MIKEHAKEQARKLYMQSDLSQQQIAGNVGVNPRTLYGWIREGDWKRARKAALDIPLMLLEQNYIQFAGLNEDILSREDRPYPTKEEADIMRKLSATIKQLKEPGNVTFADTTQVLMQFSMYLRKRDKDMSMTVVNIMNDYVDDIRPDKRSLMAMYEEKEEIMNAQTDAPIRDTPANETPAPEASEQQTAVQPDTPLAPAPGTPATIPDSPLAHLDTTDSNNDMDELLFLYGGRLADRINKEAEERQQIFFDMYKEASGHDLILPEPDPQKAYEYVMARRHILLQETQYPPTGY